MLLRVFFTAATAAAFSHQMRFDLRICVAKNLTYKLLKLPISMREQMRFPTRQDHLFA